MIRNILLAEDDRGTALFVKTKLEANGYRVRTAGNGIEALRILGGSPVDLIITDVVMPEMDGVDLYARVKENPETNEIPIIIITDKDVFKESFATLGVSNFVEKTADIVNLLQKIRQVERDHTTTKRYRKILFCSNYPENIDKMIKSADGVDYLVNVAQNSGEIMSKAMVMIPHVIAMDVMFEDNATADEIIRSLRVFHSLKDTKIITYTSLPEDFLTGSDDVASLKEAILKCNEAGADEYIGRFNQPIFVKRLA